MKKLFAICLLFCLSYNIYSREISDNSYFTILTCAPGNDVYAQFGHTAIRFVDSTNYIDIVFNYGLFSYSDNFLYNFIKGETYYQLGITRFSHFLEEYTESKRAVIEQKLNLTQFEKEKLYTTLQTNYLPQNRKYLYNFLYDNCSSRPRDIVTNLFDGKLEWKANTYKTILSDSLWFTPSFKYLNNDMQHRTWRDFLNVYVGSEKWLQLGIGLVLGVGVDKPITQYQSMFLPDCFMISLENASIQRNGKTIPLISSTEFLIAPHLANQPKSFITHPSTILWIICFIFIGLALFEFKKKQHYYWIDSLLYFIAGLFAIIIWYISFFSIHPTAFPNLNIIWLSPFHLVFAIAWLFPKTRKYIKIYLYIYSVIFVLYCITAAINPQFIPSGFIAVLLIMASRFPIGNFTKNNIIV